MSEKTFAARSGLQTSADRQDDPHQSKDENSRAGFARALTRAVFGRHYWNEDMERERRAVRKAPQKKKG